MPTRVLQDFGCAARLGVFADDGALIRIDEALAPVVDGVFCSVGAQQVQVFQRQGTLRLFAKGREFDLSNPRLRAIGLAWPGHEGLLMFDGARPVLCLGRGLGVGALRAIADPTADRIDFDSERFLLACVRWVNDKGRHDSTMASWRGGAASSTRR